MAKDYEYIGKSRLSQLLGYLKNKFDTKVESEVAVDFSDADTPEYIKSVTDLQDDMDDLEIKMNQCFQNVSDGKALIAEAITDKGIETSASATFERMADNILAISTSGGDITVMEYTDTMYIYFDEIEVIE